MDVQVEEVDELFDHIFVQKPKVYNSPKEIDPDIDKYESLSGNRLIIYKSDQFARTYKCVTHIGCCFRAKFGKVPREDQMVLKTNLTKAAHIGPRVTRLPNDRKPKRRIKGRLDGTIDQVAVLGWQTGTQRHHEGSCKPSRFHCNVQAVPSCAATSYQTKMGTGQR